MKTEIKKTVLIELTETEAFIVKTSLEYLLSEGKEEKTSSIYVTTNQLTEQLEELGI